MTANSHDTPSRLDRQRFNAFAEMIKTELGIKMPEAKTTMLQSRLQRRLRALQLDSIEDYQKRLFSSDFGAEERIHFFDVVTTNKTDFFREPAHFDYLARTALPALSKEGTASFSPRIWCAGCSSGEEPYTLAMVLSDYAADRSGVSFSILGTDISSRVLDAARSAIYAESRIAPIPMAARKRYLLRSVDPSKKLVRIHPALRSRVNFRRLNFMDPRYDIHETFDAIFFRNVMIYFDRPTQEAVVNKLCAHLKSGGYLFIGHSESLAGLNVPLRLVHSSVFQKI